MLSKLIEFTCSLVNFQGNNTGKVSWMFQHLQWPGNMFPDCWCQSVVNAPVWGFVKPLNLRHPISSCCGWCFPTRWSRCEFKFDVASSAKFSFTGTNMLICVSSAGIDKWSQHPKEGGAVGSEPWWRDLLLSLHSSWFWHQHPKPHQQSSVPHWNRPHIITWPKYHKGNSNFPVYRLGRWREWHQKSGLAEQSAVRLQFRLSCARFCLQVNGFYFVWLC